VDDFANLKHVSEDHGPLIDQATLATFMDSGAFYTHLRRCRRAYAERRQCFLETVRRFDLPFEFPNTDGGMNLAALLPSKWDDERLAEQLRANGLDVPSLSRYSVARRNPGLLFGFTAFDPRAIVQGVERVAAVIRSR
jgi:GntR family transcriptional regulator/MocR family aminotransferase